MEYVSRSGTSHFPSDRGLIANGNQSSGQTWRRVEDGTKIFVIASISFGTVPILCCASIDAQQRTTLCIY